jgi:hypothetical protein
MEKQTEKAVLFQQRRFLSDDPFSTSAITASVVRDGDRGSDVTIYITDDTGDMLSFGFWSYDGHVGIVPLQRLVETLGLVISVLEKEGNGNA